MRRTKKTEYGYGKVIYKSIQDFPDRITLDGETWYKTGFEYETVNTGMMAAQYYADAELDDDSRRVYMDAAGNTIYD